MLFLKSLDFYMLNTDANIFIHYKYKKDYIMIISIYVNNFLLISKYRLFMD